MEKEEGTPSWYIAFHSHSRHGAKHLLYGLMEGIGAALWLNINKDLGFLSLGRLQIEVLLFSSDCPEDCLGATFEQQLQSPYQ